MISMQKKVLLTLAISFFASCSQVLETVTLELDNADPLEQEQFTVVENSDHVRGRGWEFAALQ